MAVVKPTYAASAALTISLASLASTTDALMVGRASTVVDNSTNLYDTVVLSGKIEVNTSSAVTANTAINIFVVAQLDDTPTYPDGLTGSDAAFTPTSPGDSRGYMKSAASLQVDITTVGKSYYFSGLDVAALFGGTMPQRWIVFVYQTTGQILDVTGADSFIKYQGVTYTIV